MNEKHKTAKSYVEFDVDKLCELVSSIASIASPVTKIDKMEGGFNKALLMTTESGSGVIAQDSMS